MNTEDKLSSREKECVKESHDVTVLVAEALIAFEKTETGRLKQLTAAVDRIEAFEKKYVGTVSSKISTIVDVVTRRWRSMLREAVHDELGTNFQGFGRKEDKMDEEINHSKVTEEKASCGTKNLQTVEQELWVAYTKELTKLEIQAHLLSPNVMGWYTKTHDYQLINFLTGQKMILAKMQQENAEFIRLGLRWKERKTELMLSE